MATDDGDSPCEPPGPRSEGDTRTIALALIGMAAALFERVEQPLVGARLRDLRAELSK